MKSIIENLIKIVKKNWSEKFNKLSTYKNLAGTILLVLLKKGKKIKVRETRSIATKTDENIIWESRGKIRGQSNRHITRNGERTPYKMLSDIRGFKVNETNAKNLLLEVFGLSSKAYSGELTSNKDFDPNEVIHYVRREGVMRGLNTYVHKMIELLYYNRKFEKKEFWKLSEKLMTSCPTWFLLNLINWKPTWYKELSLRDLIKIMKVYLNCNLLESPLRKVQEVWIPDGKKWRVLAIAEKGVRLYLSGINKILMIYFDLILSKNDYHGFMYGRGVSTYWKEILENDLLEWPIIIEMDFSACFNNINKGPLIQSLIEKYEIPENWVRMLLAFITLEVNQPKIKDLPSLDGQIERILNKNFDLYSRNLVQGLPINPMLANIAIKNGMDDLRRQLKISPEMRVLTYADDVSIYIKSQSDFEKLGGDNFIQTLNQSEAFLIAGLQVDEKKSRIVKKYDEKRHDLKLLGLKYRWEDGQLQSETRGRPQTPKKKGRSPIEMDLSFNRVGLSPSDIEILSKEYPYIKSLHTITVKEIIKYDGLKKYFNSIISYLYKGEIRIKQNFSLKNCEENSILWKIVKSRNPKVKRMLNYPNIDNFTISTMLLEQLLCLIVGKFYENVLIESNKRYFQESKNNKINIWGEEFVQESNYTKMYSIMRRLYEFKEGLGRYDNVENKLNQEKCETWWKKSKNLTEDEKAEILKILEIDHQVEISKTNVSSKG